MVLSIPHLKDGQQLLPWEALPTAYTLLEQYLHSEQISIPASGDQTIKLSLLSGFPLKIEIRII